VVGLDEEVRFRGLAFRTLDEGVGSAAAIALSAAFFGLTHAGNRGATPLGIAVVTAGGVMLAACYLRYRSLWVPIGFHFAWNTTMGVALGLPVSGAAIPGLLRANAVGPDFWTGGAFGPEASAILPLFVFAAAGFYLWRVIAENKLTPPAWARKTAGAIAETK
jgi:hypothetical protein